MSRLVSCVPAYGRDYKTAEKVKADWEAGKDFMIQDLLIRGSYINKDDDRTGLDLKLRYNNKQDFVIVHEDGSFGEAFESEKDNLVVHEPGSPRDRDYRIE